MINKLSSWPAVRKLDVVGSLHPAAAALQWMKVQVLSSIFLQTPESVTCQGQEQESNQRRHVHSRWLNPPQTASGWDAVSVCVWAQIIRSLVRPIRPDSVSSKAWIRVRPWPPASEPPLVFRPRLVSRWAAAWSHLPLPRRYSYSLWSR